MGDMRVFTPKDFRNASRSGVLSLLVNIYDVSFEKLDVRQQNNLILGFWWIIDDLTLAWP